MKKVLLILTVLFLSSFLFARVPEFSLSFDAGLLQDVIIRTNTYQIHADARCRIFNTFQLRLPVTAVITSGERMYDIGLSFAFYPMSHGLFLGMSVVQFGIIRGSTQLEKTFYSLNEVFAGWTFLIGKKDSVKRFYLEPQIVIRDPSGVFSDAYSAIRGELAGYKNFRIRLCAGFVLNPAQSKEV
ncbi:MAG: hypothetical protein MJ052_03195 [Sphaerochaetaceae bacterium]|nr:hypothetical protein [Sphaerochaetaceae bacterium]